jgi:hypothetical protein
VELFLLGVMVVCVFIQDGQATMCAQQDLPTNGQGQANAPEISILQSTKLFLKKLQG